MHAPRAQAVSAARAAKFFRRVAQGRELYLLLFLPVVYVFVFNYVPMYGVVIAFKKYNVRLGILGSPWADPLLYNFQRFFSSPSAKMVITNTVSLSLYSLFAGFPLPILLALGLNYMISLRMKRFVQMITFAPYFLSTIIIVGLMSLLLSTQFGIVNVLIKALTGATVNFMGNVRLFRHLYVWSGVWQGMGYSSVVYVAALASVDPEMHEAAIIDGASILRRIRHIDLPTILPTIVILLILSMGHIFSIGFEKVYLMQNAQNLSVSQTIETYLYQVGISTGRPDYSFATAIGLFQNIVGVLMTLVVNAVSKRVTGSGLI